MSLTSGLVSRRHVDLVTCWMTLGAVPKRTAGGRMRQIAGAAQLAPCWNRTERLRHGVRHCSTGSSHLAHATGGRPLLRGNVRRYDKKVKTDMSESANTPTVVL